MNYQGSDFVIYLEPRRSTDTYWAFVYFRRRPFAGAKTVNQ